MDIERLEHCAGPRPRGSANVNLRAFSIALFKANLCHITKELPVNAVVAEDGLLYERSEVEKLIRDGEWVAGVGKNLVPSYSAQYAIAAMIEFGDLPDVIVFDFNFKKVKAFMDKTLPGGDQAARELLQSMYEDKGDSLDGMNGQVIETMRDILDLRRSIADITLRLRATGNGDLIGEGAQPALPALLESVLPDNIAIKIIGGGEYSNIYAVIRSYDRGFYT